MIIPQPLSTMWEPSSFHHSPLSTSNGGGGFQRPLPPPPTGLPGSGPGPGCLYPLVDHLHGEDSKASIRPFFQQPDPCLFGKAPPEPRLQGLFQESFSSSYEGDGIFSTGGSLESSPEQQDSPPWMDVAEATFTNSLRLSPTPSLEAIPLNFGSGGGVVTGEPSPPMGDCSVSSRDDATDTAHDLSIYRPPPAKKPCSPPSSTTSSTTDTTTTTSTTTTKSCNSGTSAKDASHVLPLCKVCGVQATGFHYGVNTCEACKGFFHRSIGRQTEYRCYKNSRCEIKPGGRSFCPRCRFKKCIEVGMSKEGIKTGRYTYEKRTRDIMEVKKQRIEAVTAKEVERTEQEEQELDEFIASIVKAKERLLSELQVIEDTSTTIVAVHHDDPENRLHLPRFSPDMEPNADMSAIWKKWVSVIENTGGLQRLIKFVKTIPGFRELDMTDQIQLIKHSFCELWVVSKHHKFDILRKCYTNNFGFTFNLVKALGEDYAEHVLAVADRLQMMELSSEETCVLLTFLIFATDRCPLLKPVKVEQIAAHVLSALVYIIQKKHPYDRLRFAKITAILTELRTITDHYHKHNEHILSDVGQISPLLWEIFNLS